MRVDAGFVAGDEVSSHYDPMIAKLIVQGPDRSTTISKLNAALNNYEIAGPITNVGFLKRVCQNEAFVAGEVETGFINKWRESLFHHITPPPEVYAQAAIGAFNSEIAALLRTGGPSFGPQSGFVSSSQKRSFKFIQMKATVSPNISDVTVEVQQTAAGVFDISVDGESFNSIASKWDITSRTVTSYFPHTRLETRFIQDGADITLFQKGEQYRLRYATPKWIEKALGIKDTAHSVLAPMPCKILRVEVEPGMHVKKDQVLVVIESMKMETSIRSPQDGMVSRIVHGKGELCKAGTALVEFEDSGEFGTPPGAKST